MNKFIVRTTNVAELEKFATINVGHKAKFMDIVILETTLSRKRLLKIKGVYSVENDEVFEAFSS